MWLTNFRQGNNDAPYNYTVVGLSNLQEEVGSLKAWTRYMIVVRAYNAHGTGPLSQAVIIQTMQDGEYGFFY